MPEPKSYARRLVKGSTIVFTAFIASGLIGLFLRMFLARSLTVAEYGLFYAVFALISFFGLFRDLGLNSALVKYVPEFSVKKQPDMIKSSMIFATAFQTVFAFLVAAVLFVLSDQIALVVFRTAAATLPLRVLCVWFFVMVFYYIFRSAFQGFQEMLAYASMEFFYILSILFLTILLVSGFGQGVAGVAYAYLLGTLAVAALGLGFFRRKHPRIFREKTFITKPLIKKLLAFALPIFIGGIGGMIVGYTDTIMITIFRSLPEVGFYQAAQPAAYILWYFPISLAIVIFPMISELWVKREKKLLGNTLHFLTKFSLILIIPAALIFIAFPKIVISLLFGPNYLAGAMALQILSATAIVVTLYLTLSHAMHGIGKPFIIAKIVAVIAGLNLVGNLLLIPAYGIEGAAIATLFSYLLGLVLVFYYTQKFVKFTVPSMSLFKTITGGVLTLLLILGLKSALVLPPWPEAFAVMIPGLAFYGVWILATKAVTKDDLMLIKEIVPMPKRLIKVARRFVGSR